MSLDMQNFDLFTKKKPIQALKPVVTPEPVVEEVIIEEVVVAPVIVEEKIEVPHLAKETLETKQAKYETFLPVTARIPEADSQELKKIENTIMRNRKKGGNAHRERITTNSILRCVIANFLERANDLDLTNIENEEELAERLEKAFKQKYVKKSPVC